MDDDLLEAVRSGNVDDITRLLNSRSEEVRCDLLLTDFSFDGQEQQTLLNIVALRGSQELVKALLNGLNGHQRSQVFMNEVSLGHVAPIGALLSGLSVQGRFSVLTQGDSSGRTALMYAARNGNEAAIKALLEGLKGEDRLRVLNHGDGRRVTALMYAARNGNAAAIEALLENLQGDNRVAALNHQDDNRVTALMYAAGHGNEEVINVLLADLQDAEMLEVINQTNYRGETALINAIVNRNAEAIMAILANFEGEHRLEVLRGNTERITKTALMYAAENNNLETVAALLENLQGDNRVAALNHQDDNGETALMYAAGHGHVAAIEALLSGLGGAERLKVINQTNYRGETALMCAAFNGHVAAIEALLAGLEGEDINQGDNNGVTALMYAAGNGHEDVIVALLSGLEGKDRLSVLNQRDGEGVTALMHAAENNNLETIAALLKNLTAAERSKVLNYQDENGVTALIREASNGNVAAIDALLSGLERDDRLSVLNHGDVRGSTALIRAASNGNEDVIATLLSGLEREDRLRVLNHQDGNGVTALMYAARNGHAAPNGHAVVKAVLNYLPQDRRVELVRGMLDGLVNDFFTASAGNGAAPLNEKNINTLEFLFKTGYVSEVSEDTKIKIKILATKNRMPFSVFNLLANAVNAEDYNSLLGYFRDENNYTLRNIRQSYDELLRMSRQDLTDFKEVEKEVEAELNNKLVNIDESFSNVSYRKILQGLDLLFFGINDINELAAYFKRVSDKLGQILSFDSQSSFVARMIDGYLVGKYKLSEELIEQIVSNSDEPLTQKNLRAGIGKVFKSVIVSRGMDRLRDQNTPPAPQGTAPEHAAAALPPAPPARAAGGAFTNRVGQRRPSDQGQPAGSNTRNVRQRTEGNQHPRGVQGPQGRGGRSI